MRFVVSIEQDNVCFWTCIQVGVGFKTKIYILYLDLLWRKQTQTYASSALGVGFKSVGNSGEEHGRYLFL